SLFGRHHIYTFDGVIYEFPGDCSYLLAGDCNHHSFTLLDFQNGKRTGITLFLGDVFELHLSVDGQLSQGGKLSLPYASHAVFVGSELGFYKLWSEEFGFAVTIDNAANIAVTMTKLHSNRTCGLCGNFNAIPSDEYTAQEFLTEDSYDFANSWAVKGADQACRRVSDPTQSCNSPKCPIGMQYSECAKPCSTTCHSLNIQEVCKEECVDGCTCPGKVLDGNRCVEVSQCSCTHMGRHFPPGSTISQDCNTVCRHGSWECTNEGCPECLVVGQSHFKSFDNKFFTFTGHCQYLLAKDCTNNGFSVIIENVQCADDQDAVCTRSVTLSLPSLENMTVKLKHGGVVSVNSMDIQTPMNHSVRVRFGDDLRLDWDGRGRVLLKLGPRWTGQTCGLCGNYNGNHGDDFLSGSGLVEASPQAFGQAWRINGDCESTHKHDTDPCATNPKRRYAEEACAVIMSDVFSSCHFLVNPAPFQRFCRYDVCACGDGEQCLCSVLSAYAAACSAKGVLLNWRSHSLEMECHGGQLYEACGSTCERTCRSLSGAEPGCEGERVCEEGCFCPAGKYLSPSGECVTVDMCPCLHDGQLYQPSDVYADHNSIYCENGAMRCSSTEMTSFLSDLFYDDDTVPSRRRSAQCPPPLVHSECSSGERGLECARTCQNLDLPCVSLACIPGCLCPPGTVRHRRDCIQPEQCPCYHNNRPYSAGRSITVDCNTVCENRKWRCTQKLCDGVCRTVGEGHYITFDGLKYSFPGLCQYVLVQDMCHAEEGSFRVLVENEACGIVGHRCAKAVTIFYHGGLIVMQDGEQVTMKTPVLQSSQVEIIRSGQFYTVMLGKHISLSWDRGTRLLVHISASYRKGRVCGLCGNFDGNVNNDLMSSNNQMEVDASHFGNSWKVIPSCADVTEMPAPCSDNIVKLVTVEQSCRVITGPLFKECNSQVDAEAYVEMCVEAACSCSSVGDCACFCDAIAAYAQACSEKGVSVMWRSNELCMSCEELNPKLAGTREELCQWRYNTCGLACPITCQHPDPLHCSLMCVEGCHAYCPPQILDEVAMQCVDPSQCQVCIHEGQRISHGNKVILNHDDPTHCKIKWLFKKTVRELHYTGGDAAFLDEAVKYLAINIYDKNKRDNAGRVAIILTASGNPRPVRAIVKMLRKKAITTLTVALGPGVNMGQINDITKANPDNRAYVLSSTGELSDRLLELTDYLCTLGMEPEMPKPTPSKARRASPTTSPVSYVKTTPAQHVPSTLASTAPSGLPPAATIPPYHPPATDVTFIIEGSDTVGEANFNKSLIFLEEVISQLTEKEEFISITVIQYSITVTVEISRWELRQQREHLLQRLRQIRWRGGSKTNTGAAVTTTLQEMATIHPPHVPAPPQLVFLVTENPPTDTVTRPPTTSTQTRVYPIGVGPKVHETDLVQFSHPQRPMMVEDYSRLTSLVHRVVNITQTTVRPLSPTLPPCKKPLDVMFLLKAGEQFEDMKTFVKTFISNSDIVKFAVQASISSVSGGRVGVPKVVVMVMTEKSTDDIKEAANEAFAAVSVFPIGVGPNYDSNDLSVLGHHGNQDNTLHLNNMDQLRIFLTLDKSYTERICRGPPGLCVDDNGNERKQPGESWLLDDGCHSVLCHPSGAVTVQNHKISCDRLEPPACRNNMPPVRVEEACGCRWECPICMGSSTNHVVRFDGLALRLEGEGLCSYTLLTVSKGNSEGSEVKLHTGPCQDSAKYSQICMKSMEVTHGPYTLLLKDDITVSGVAMGCQALRSEVFEKCHAYIAVQVFLIKCEEQACDESDVCEIISAYARLCKQSGVCVDWRSPHLCLHCPNAMEYDACWTGCVEDCGSIQALPGDWSTTRHNESSCMATPTEGCFCTGGTVLHHGKCVSPESCRQCQHMQSWVPDDNPCLICMCLDQQHINCTARPCNDVKPVCGPCEILQEKKESKCCPEYECCDLVNCDLPDVPRCEDGQTVVLKNPGECQPIHECCKKEECSQQDPPDCPAHRQLSTKKTKCCDSFECTCNCQNSTHSCPTGFVTSSFTNDCACTEILCQPDKVCVVGGVVHPVGSEWEEGCEKCRCTELQDRDTSLHVAQCSPPVCNRNCPVVGEKWLSAHDKCVENECRKVKDEVFISTTNVSCGSMETTSCPLGSELRCDTQDCCPRCHCRMDACVLNHTVIGAGERVMVDMCTHCECTVENGAVKKYKLSCKQASCPSCPRGYAMQKEEDSCCGRCVATACFIQKPDGKLTSLQVNSTHEDGCYLYACGVNSRGDLVLETKQTTCPPFNRQACLDQGGKVSQIGKTCNEPECRRTAGTLNYVKVDDCQSEQQIELHYCEGKCRSKSMYSLQSAAVEQECVCCAAVKTEPLSVPVLCANGTRSHHTVQSVTTCD
uniref:von Willebrand factor n=1 Tax=Xiphophorus maculatus TaxID=8083 RepID=M3ZNL1_XIPMA